MKAIELTREQSENYADHGPIGSETRRAIQREALELSRSDGGSRVEVYSDDGIVFFSIRAAPIATESSREKRIYVCLACVEETTRATPR